ncbi:anti-sigma factor antagonist [Streptomyces sp. NPDC051546]|uniref:anti-sigma factor antagonist n=1 Tax=Streptomyces sp. NPDC051546 TaxID=3365655 RepID=UPI0037B139E3
MSRGNSYEHLTESISLVKVVSDMDVYDASSVRTVVVDLLKQGRFFLVVDLTASDMLDSTGVGVLVGALKRVHGHAGALALVVTSERMLTQFRVTGLAKVFAIFPTVDQAVEFLGREGLRTDG